MENSYGDVHFIRKLHAKCEQESGLVLKRYIKYRKLQDVVLSFKATPTSTSVVVAAADLHSIQDELALLIQYCCMYGKYLKQVCTGINILISQH